MVVIADAEAFGREPGAYLPCTGGTALGERHCDSMCRSTAWVIEEPRRSPTARTGPCASSLWETRAVRETRRRRRDVAGTIAAGAGKVCSSARRGSQRRCPGSTLTESIPMAARARALHPDVIIVGELIVQRSGPARTSKWSRMEARRDAGPAVDLVFRALYHWRCGIPCGRR